MTPLSQADKIIIVSSACACDDRLSTQHDTIVTLRQTVIVEPLTCTSKNDSVSQKAKWTADTTEAVRTESVG